MTDWWEYPGNFSNGLEVNSTGTLMKYLNYSTGNHLGFMLIIAAGMIIFLSLKTSFSTIKSINAMSIVIFFLSIPMAMMDILTWTWCGLLGVMAVLTTLMMRSDSQLGL
jgi:hypothetical protein